MATVMYALIVSWMIFSEDPQEAIDLQKLQLSSSHAQEIRLIPEDMRNESCKSVYSRISKMSCKPMRA
jgi:hypothetical protein